MSVTHAKGFMAAGVAAGIRKGDGPDVALVVNQGPAFDVAVTTTTNRFAAACVNTTKRHAANGQARAVVLNAGCANACTGRQGAVDALAMAQHTAQNCNIDVNDVLVCSTGMIGENLPMAKVTSGIRAATVALCDTPQAGMDAANAILTTDTHAKTVTYDAPDAPWRIGAMIKGAGMLAPGMATMLCVITTDAHIPAEQLQACLNAATAKTLNRVDSDGCMSTNDTVVLMASGASGCTPNPQDFFKALMHVMHDLAYQLISDAEGVNHRVAITVKNAANETAAEVAARAIARSNLVKCAIYGNDPNWGRIVSELGTIPEELLPFNPAQVDVIINGVTVFTGATQGEPRDSVDMSPVDVNITIDINNGSAEATVLTNDLTHDYIHINADYSS